MTQDVKKLLKRAGFTIFFVGIVAYAFFQSRDLIFGVQIRNINIVDGAKVENNILNITGNARNATNLSLDGRTISTDQAGNFSETLVLLSGYNIINMRAEDKFGHVDVKNYQLIY